MIPMVLLPPVVLWFGKIIHERFEQIQEHFSTLSTFVQENLSGIRIVRAYVQEEEQADQFAELNEEYRERNMHLIRASGLFHPLLGLLSGGAMVIVLWVGGTEVMAGAITEGAYVAFFFYLAFLIWPMIALGWVVNLYQRGAASMGRLNKIFRTEPALEAPERPVPLGDARGEIEFRDVSFRYPGTERRVLKEVSFTARPGETVALVGPTGSGKTTVVKLIPRLYDPTEGEIRIDGVPLTDCDLTELRGMIGVVPQEAFLFSDTILDNIALGIEGEDGDVAVAGPGEPEAGPGPADEVRVIAARDGSGRRGAVQPRPVIAASAEHVAHEGDRHRPIEPTSSMPTVLPIASSTRPPSPSGTRQRPSGSRRTAWSMALRVQALRAST